MPDRLVIRRCRPFPAPAGISGVATVVVEGERVALVTEGPVAPRPGDWEVDADDRLLTPGFVDAHTHLTRRLAVGLGGGGSYPPGYPQLEEPLRGRFERALEGEDVRAAAELGLCEAALAGTTSVFELLRAPGHALGSLDALGAAAQGVGVRLVAAYGASDLDGLRESVRFARDAGAGGFGPLVRGALGLAHPEELEAADLSALVELAQVHGLLLHAGETERDLAASFRRHGKSSVEHLAELGLLGPKTVAAHCNQLSRREAELLAQASGFCAYTPRAALLSAEPPPRLEAAVAAGAYSVLGTEGLAASVRSEVPWALALWRRTARPASAPGVYPVERMALEAGARLAGRFFDGARAPLPLPASGAGLLAVGQVADLVLLDHRLATRLEAASASGHLALGIADARVAWTVVAGRVLVREGVLLTGDLARATARAHERAERLWARL